MKHPSNTQDNGHGSSPILDVRNLKKYFPVLGGLLNRRIADVQAVDNISFVVHKGETLGIVGESGCGKSTTARLLIGLIAVSYTHLRAHET